MHTDIEKWDKNFVAAAAEILDKTKALVRLSLPESTASAERETQIALHAACMAELVRESGVPMGDDHLRQLFNVASEYVLNRQDKVL